MNEDALKLLQDILAFPPELLTEEQKGIIKGRVSYLTPEEIARYPFLKGVRNKVQLPKQVFTPTPVVKENPTETETIVTAVSAPRENLAERAQKLADRKLMENGAADPDADPQTVAAKIQEEKLEDEKENPDEKEKEQTDIK